MNIRRRSYSIAAGVTVDGADAQGVLFAHGGVAGSHSLFIKDGRLHYVYNWLGERVQTVSSADPIPTGRHVFSAEFTKTGDEESTGSAAAGTR